MLANGVEARWTPAQEFGAMIAREGDEVAQDHARRGIKPE
jgi:hypothetical protein